MRSEILKILIVVVVASVVILIGVGLATDFFGTQNQKKNLNLRSIGDITATPETYIGKRITVEGFYYQGSLANGYGYITTAIIQQPIVQGSFSNVQFLIMNYSGYNMATFLQGVQYYFTGTLLSQNSTLFPGQSYLLSIEAIEHP